MNCHKHTFKHTSKAEKYRVLGKKQHQIYICNATCGAT